jgi:hypothetical protein
VDLRDIDNSDAEYGPLAQKTRLRVRASLSIFSLRNVAMSWLDFLVLT